MGGNNLKIDINKDFLKEYKNDFYKGFSVTDIVHILAGLSVSAVIMTIAVMLFKIDVVFAVYISVPFAALFILAGIYKYQEYLSPKEYVLERQYTQSISRIHYETDEPDVSRYFTMHHSVQKHGSMNSVLEIIRKKVG